MDVLGTNSDNIRNFAPKEIKQRTGMANDFVLMC